MIIGIAGGSSRGKTSFAEALHERTKSRSCIFNLDNFYKEIDPSLGSNHNWDHPNSFDVDKIKETLLKWKQRQPQTIQKYNFSLYSYLNVLDLPTCNVLIVEGLYAFYYPELNDLIDYKIFIDCDSDTALKRRILRDINERGYDLALVLKRYENYVKPMYETYVVKQKKMADFVVINSGNISTSQLRVLNILEKFIATNDIQT